MISRRGLGAGLIAAALIPACATLENATDQLTQEVSGPNLILEGVITTPSARAFEQTLAENPQLRTVVMMRVFGSLDDQAVIRMGYALRDAGLNTQVPGTGLIESGAVDLFLAGVRRSVGNGATVGVHSWADGFGEGSSYPRNAPEHRALAQYTRDMLGSDAFYWFSLNAAPSDQIYRMSRREMRAYGVINTAN